MSPFRYRDEPPYIYSEEEEEEIEDESSSRSALYIAIGAAAGFAAGVLMAERFGGFKGLTDRIKDTFGGGTGEEEEEFDYEGLDEDEFDPDFDDDFDTPKSSLNGAEALEERVLEAFRNDHRAHGLGQFRRGSASGSRGCARSPGCRDGRESARDPHRRGLVRRCGAPL
jgi:hypothetical protein